MREAATTLTGPPERPAGDYGNPDPEWRQIDWRRHLRRVELPGQLGQLRRDRRGRAAALRPRALRLLAELAREPAPLRPQPPGDRPRPARLRRQPDACLGDRHPGLRAPPARLLREARDRALRRRGRQLDGRLRLDRGGDPAAGALRAAGPGLGRRNDPRPGPQRAGRLAGQAGADERAGRSPASTGPAWCGRRARYLAFRGLFRHPNRLSPELLYEQVEPALRSPGFADALRELVGYDLRDRAGEIEIPTLVLWGFNDRIVPVAGRRSATTAASPTPGWRSSSAPGTSRSWSAPPASTGCSTSSSSRSSARRLGGRAGLSP